MYDYVKLYPSKIYERRSASKLNQIRRLLISNIPPEAILLLIAAVVLPMQVVASIKFRR